VTLGGRATAEVGNGGHRRIHPQTPTATMWATSGLAVVVWLLTATSAFTKYPVVLGKAWPVPSC